MELPEQLLCLFNAEVERRGDEYVVTVPRREVETGTLDPGSVYRVALLSNDGGTDGATESGARPETAPTEPQPPVEPGEVRYVEIEDLGKQGDGIARVERGYVIIVPDAEVGDRVKIEVSEVKQNFAIGEAVEEEF